MQFFSDFTSAFRKDSKFQLFFLSVLTVGLSYGLYKGIIDNYLAEAVAMTEFDKGVSEFFRELPGLLLVFILAAFYMLSAETLYKLGAVIMLAGMMMQTVVPENKVMVILAIILYSLGDHIQLGGVPPYFGISAREGRSARAWVIQLHHAGGQLDRLFDYQHCIPVRFRRDCVSGGFCCLHSSDCPWSGICLPIDRPQ